MNLSLFVVAPLDHRIDRAPVKSQGVCPMLKNLRKIGGRIRLNFFGVIWRKTLCQKEITLERCIGWQQAASNEAITLGDRSLIQGHSRKREESN